MKSAFGTRAAASVLFVATMANICTSWFQAFWPTSLANVVAFALAVTYLIPFFRKEPKPELSPVLIPLTAVAIWPLVQIAAGTTVYDWATSVLMLNWATNAAVTFVAFQVLKDPSVRRSYLRALVAAGLVLGVIAPLQLYAGDGRVFWLFPAQYTRMMMGPLFPNQYAAFVEILLPIALTMAFRDRANWRTVHSLAAMVLYASVIASGSRAGFALATIELLIVPCLAAKREDISLRQVVVPAAIFVAFLAILALAAGPQTLIAKFAQKDIYIGRFEFLRSSVNMIRERPLMGFGLGNWPFVYPAFATFDNGWFANAAHNDWAQWTAEGGVPFALMMFSIALWSARWGYRSLWGIGVSVVFVHCLVDFPIAETGIAMLFFTVAGAMARHDRESSRGGSPRRNASRDVNAA